MWPTFVRPETVAKSPEYVPRFVAGRAQRGPDSESSRLGAAVPAHRDVFFVYTKVAVSAARLRGRTAGPQPPVVIVQPSGVMHHAEIPGSVGRSQAKPACPGPCEATALPDKHAPTGDYHAVGPGPGFSNERTHATAFLRAGALR